MKLLNWYISYVWPIQRRFVRNVSRRCSECITSEKCLTLGEYGVCGECNMSAITKRVIASYGPSKFGPFKSSDDVKSILRKIRLESKYDVAVLLSGGKDSCYLLSRLKLEHRLLNVLAIFVDNGFSSKQAITNCKAICKATKTDLVIEYESTMALKGGLRQAFLKMKETNGTAYDVIDFTDGSAVFKIGQKLAKRHGCQMVLTGLSKEQTVLHGGSLLVENDEGVVLSPFVAWNPSDEDIYAWLKKKHGMSRRQFDPTLTNHSLIPVMCAVDVLNHGYCSFEREFSNRIRRGEADRKKWLHTFEFLEYSVKKGWLHGMMSQELAKLNLTIADVTRG